MYPCPDETVIGGGNTGGSDPVDVGDNCQMMLVTTTWYSQVCDPTGCGAPTITDITQSLEFVCDSDGATAAWSETECDPVDEEIPILEPDTPPDCESFKYVKTTTDAHWQEAAVAGIYFEVYILEPGATRKKYVKIEYDQPIWFGLPTKRFDGTLISPGKAAEISANVLNVAMSQTAHYFRGVRSSRIDVRNYFQRTLKSLMPFGGKANFNFTGSRLVVPSQYKVRYFGTGNCD